MKPGSRIALSFARSVLTKSEASGVSLTEALPVLYWGNLAYLLPRNRLLDNHLRRIYVLDDARLTVLAVAVLLLRKIARRLAVSAAG